MGMDRANRYPEGLAKEFRDFVVDMGPSSKEYSMFGDIRVISRSD